MIPVALAFLAASGCYLLYTAVVLGQRELRSPVARASRTTAWGRWLTRQGIVGATRRDLAIATAGLLGLGGLGGLAAFGGPMPALATGVFAGSLPIAAHRARRRADRAAAMDAWPRMLEELRIRTSSLGRSIPQALVEVGRGAPDELRPAFAAAEREWFLTTDFSRMVAVLKSALADPTADAACETLLVAHDVGGSDLDRRLDALIDDRIQDAQGRKDARAKQAGARFARKFVLVVPAGMAFAGMSVGTGRDAYQTPSGQVLVVVAIALVAACWIWAGAVMNVPEAERVFDRDEER